MVNMTKVNPSVVSNTGTLSGVTDPAARFQLALAGLTQLAQEGGTLRLDMNAHVRRLGMSDDVLSAAETFNGAYRNLGDAVGQAAQIMQGAQKRAASFGSDKPVLTKDEAQKLEDLNEKANKAIENMVEVLKQLRFRNPKDDEGPHGGASAPPSILVSTEV